MTGSDFVGQVGDVIMTKVTVVRRVPEGVYGDDGRFYPDGTYSYYGGRKCCSGGALPAAGEHEQAGDNGDTDREKSANERIVGVLRRLGWNCG